MSEVETAAESRGAAFLGLVLALALVLLSFVVPRITGWDVHIRSPRTASARTGPPLHSLFAPRWFGPGTVPALVIAGAGWWWGPRLARRLSWRWLLITAYGVAVGWLLSLALVDGPSGISRVLGNRYEYLPTARAVHDVPALLHGFIDRIPLDRSGGDWPTSVAGHPVGMLLFFVALVRVGLGGDLSAGLVVIVLAASVPVAVLTTLRALGSEPAARQVAPFMVLTPAAVFLAVSADAVITTIAGWGIACLALGAAATRTGRMAAWSGLAGLLLGVSLFLSYGMLLMGVLALAVLLAARSWRPLPVALVVAVGVVVAFAWAGFAWWEAYAVLRQRYYDGIAGSRPWTYWVWGNLASFLISGGPLIAAGLACAFHRLRVRRSPCLDDSARAVVILVAAAVVMVAAADLSGMSKGEVERIWLPFVPWVTVSVVLLPANWRRRGLLLQLATALAVQHLFNTFW